MSTLKYKALFIERIQDLRLSARISAMAIFLLGLAASACAILAGEWAFFWVGIPVMLGGMVACLPAFLVLSVLLHGLRRNQPGVQAVLPRLLWFCLLSVVPYGIVVTLVALLLNPADRGLPGAVLLGSAVTTILFTAMAIAAGYNLPYVIAGLLPDAHEQVHTNQISNMETNNTADAAAGPATVRETSNRYMIKGLITGALILLMLVPTLFISNLVREREHRQKEVAAEVSQKWSAAQTVSGPYIFLPYRHFEKMQDGRLTETQRHIWILPEQLHVDGKVDHQVRKRSIYNVLLYRAGLQVKGNFQFHLPRDIDPANVIWQDARLCAGISDFKGIEEKVLVHFQGMDYELSPGLPSEEIDKKGLSAAINLSAADIDKPLAFSASLKLKGSSQLHFKPLSGNSVYSLRSAWPSPSFDGNSLPGEREVSDSGFMAKWTFNKANLPYGTILRDVKIDEESIAFGLTLLQPADQYSKTDRSVKYAILFIGLTFSLFFIVEILQQKPVHPVQYILIGLALVIFYTLLLSISEFLAFDIAYLISSLATVSLIALYARAHFRKWSSAGLFAGVLGLLYGFIFVLIRLEDTALLVGSIALFLVLALVMFASRKINWYGNVPAGRAPAQVLETA